MENIPKINLSDLTPEKQARLDDGIKIFDLETQKYYEKVEGKFEEMLEEGDNPSEPITDEVVPKAADLDADAIKEIVASGDKLLEANAFMKLSSVKNELLGQEDLISQKMNFIFSGTPEQLELVDLRVSEATEEAIKNATMEEIKPFFTFDDNFVDLNFTESLPEEEKVEAYREYLLYLKSIDSAKKEIAKQTQEIDELCKNFSADIQAKSKSMAEWDKYIYTLFEDRLKDPKITDEEKARIKRLIEIREEAITLKPLYDNVKKEIDLGRRHSLIHAFQTRFLDTLKKCEAYAEQNNFHIYFQMFDGVEDKIGYSDYHNLFVYIFARYIKFNREKLSKMDNAYIAQISQNLILLKKDQMEENNKVRFTKSITDILDLVIAHN